MSYYKDFNLFSQFSYAKQHFINASQAFSPNPTSNTDALREIALGVLELTPVLGLFAAYLEKLTENSTSDKRIAQRELFVKEQIASDSFHLQSLYFDTQSSPRLHNTSNSFKARMALSDTYSEFHKLDDSYPDFQIFALIDELSTFKADLEENSPERIKIEALLRKLEEAKASALLISEIMASYSVTDKEALREKLSDLLHTQISGMTAGDSILIPCGYMNGNIYNLFGKDVASGHSTTIKLTKEADHSFSLSLYNAASLLHQAHPNDPSRVYPYIIRNITPERLLSGDLLTRLTKFSYNEDGTPYEEEALYQLLDTFGHKQTDFSAERAYHKQESVGNCTKKSLQAWLHEELSENDLLYSQFRSFKLNHTLNQVRPSIKNFWGMFYTVPLAAVGGSTNSIPASIALKIAGFLFGSSVKRRISQQAISTLFWDAQNLAEVRARKSEGETVKMAKLPTHLFMNSSIENILHTILQNDSAFPSRKTTLALEMLGADLAAGYSFHPLDPSSNHSPAPSHTDEDSEALDTQLISSEVVDAPDIEHIISLLEGNERKIAFLQGYVGMLAKIDRLPEAVALANRYKETIKNPLNDDGDILTAFRAIFPTHRINSLSDLDKIEAYRSLTTTP